MLMMSRQRHAAFSLILLPLHAMLLFLRCATYAAAMLIFSLAFL